MSNSNNSTEQEIIQNSEITVPGWVLYTLLQHTETCWKSSDLTLPQAEVTINSYRLGSRLLRETINSKREVLETVNGSESVVRETAVEGEISNQDKPKKKRKPKK